MRYITTLLVIAIASLAVAACGGGTGTSTTPTPGAEPTQDPGFDAAAHFRGRTIRIVVPYATGGGTDLAARYFAAHWGSFIPGNPRVEVSNRTPTPAGRNFVWTSEPDGLVLGFDASPAIAEQYTDAAQWITTDFRYVGATSDLPSIWFIDGNLPYDSIADAVGASGPQLVNAVDPDPRDLSPTAGFGPLLLADFLDLPLRAIPVSGARSTGELLVMYERGEINSLPRGVTWYELPTTRPGWTGTGRVTPFAYTGPVGTQMMPNSETDRVAPNVYTLLRNDEQRDLWSRLVVPFTVASKFFFAAPETPEPVLNALREAFQAALADDGFRTEYEQLIGASIVPMYGMELENAIRESAEAFDPDLYDSHVLDVHAKYTQAR